MVPDDYSDYDEDSTESANSSNETNFGSGGKRSGKKRKFRADYRDAVTGNVANILSTSVIVKVGLRGIQAKISKQSLTSSTNASVTLDASASVDADNNLGDLQVSCLKY